MGLKETLFLISLSYLIQNFSGPFGLISKFKHLLIINKYVGSFFFKVFDCTYCLTFWLSIPLYFIISENYSIMDWLHFSLISAWGALIIDLYAVKPMKEAIYPKEKDEL